jgi:hypothetical protein
MDYVDYRFKTLRNNLSPKSKLKYASEYMRLVMIECPRPMT